MSATGWPAAVGTPAFNEKVASTKVLMVGAGGIGCELLKTLVLSGFKLITIIDLDTIETSNLNRQFLFRRQHVGHSKAKVAAEAVQRFAPNAVITAHEGNVKDHTFGLDFFQGFDMVLNGLDNVEARRHVNRLCLAADIPLVESGTEGYKGQVTVHRKGETECYECTPKPAPKTYPVCTLRNTPDKPIHCIVWAKDMLFARLFGPPDAVSDLDDAPAATTGEAATSGGEGEAAPDGAEAGPTPPPRSAFLRTEGEGSWAFAQRVYRRVFSEDVQSLLAVEDMWLTRAKPHPLELHDILSAEELQAPNSCVGPAATSVSTALGFDHHATWSLKEDSLVFLHALHQYHTHRAAQLGSAVFDKDDALAVDFVAAAANLRSACYDIPTQTLFSAKGMAGNIIHAIATTNAIISGLIVIEALKMVAAAPAASRNVMLLAEASRSRARYDAKLLQPLATGAPSPACAVCGKGHIVVKCDTSSFTLEQLLTQVVKGAMAVSCPTLMTPSWMYEEGEDLEPDEVAEHAAHRPKALAALPGGGVCNGCVLAVSDQDQHLTASLAVMHAELDPEEHPEGFQMMGSVPEVGDAPKTAGEEVGVPQGGKLDAGMEGEGGIIEFLSSDDEGQRDDGAGTSAAGAKRGREEDDDDPGSSKRQKQDGEPEVIEID